MRKFEYAEKQVAKPTVTYLDPSPYANKIYDYSISGFEEKKKTDCYFHIYPNPVKNNLNIQSSGDSGIGTIEIKNIFSQVVLLKDGNNQTEITLDLSSLPNGVYFICISGDASHIQKIIKN